jgi:alanine racemase
VRATRADVDLDAVADNVRALVDAVAPAEVCAVVKADGYGHGAIAVGQAALDAGASWLGVALVEEGVVLRRAGIDAPILLLSEPRPSDIDAAVAKDLRLTVYTPGGIAAIASSARRQRGFAPVHLKVNTGMNRVGANPVDVRALARQIADTDLVELEALWTHCAVADEPDNPFTDVQLDRFDAAMAELEAEGLAPRLRHAANTAAAIDHPRSRYDVVRVGIGVYGIAPAPALADRLALRPALSLRAEVSMVKRVAAGEGVSYGLVDHLESDRVVATVPIGYADGLPRRLSRTGGEVLIGGRRRRILGVVTMDQIMVDCGDDLVDVGDEVVLIGRQGDEVVTAQEWADRLDTIAYEVVCGIGPRVPRHYTPQPAPRPLQPSPSQALSQPSTTS